jgi:hypothetical protein
LFSKTVNNPRDASARQFDLGLAQAIDDRSNADLHRFHVWATLKLDVRFP